MVLQQLDLQKNLENSLKIDRTLNLKKNKLKPNFSFNLNDINRKEQKINHSVSLLPKKNNQVEEEEIKEDIAIECNLNDDKVNNEEKYSEQKNFTNLSQNISLDKYDKDENNQEEDGNKREKDLNTVAYNDFEDGEKKNNDVNDSNNIIPGSIQQEDNFDIDEINGGEDKNENV